VQLIDSSPTYIVTCITGYFDEPRSAQFIKLLDEWRGQRTGLHAFHDVSGAEDYDVAARERVSQWSRTCLHAFDGVHVLVQGRTVAWGLKIISMVSGRNIVSHHARDAFEAALRHVAHTRLWVEPERRLTSRKL
jgi:hypothetical protein